MAGVGSKGFLDNLAKIYAIYTGGFILFVIGLAIGEQMGLSNKMIGYTFMGLTIALYAFIGISSRTSKVSEYYVAGRSVPPVFNGMATGSDWMSAASFIGMAGTIFGLGYDGLAYIMGWTGGYVLLAVFLGPYLRKFGQYTIPDFLGARFGGHAARTIGIIAAITASFTYLIAQVTGVGIIMGRFLGLDFATGVFVGLMGILVCSMLGGMKAVTWTQVAQYIILIIAYLVPPVTMSQKVTGVPIPEIMYGQVLQKIDAKEKLINADPKETEVRELWKAEAAKIDADIKGLPASLGAKKAELEAKLAALPPEATAADKEKISKSIAGLPKTPEEAKEKWTAANKAAVGKSKPIKPYLQPFARLDMKNMLALTFCLMVGTAGLPHILMRYYTTPSVQDARKSVGWSLFFIFLLYFTAPSVAAFARNEVLNNIIGLPITQLPQWMANWGKVGLVSFKDINADGLLQFYELTIGPDAIVLAMPEIAGLPYTISGLVAAGGLAAALSTADGLLLTISNSLSHDLYYKMINPKASINMRLAISRTLLVIVALISAYVATFKLTIIVELVAWAFSIAAASFFPALVMGIWDKRANKAGALAGMYIGFFSCLIYMIGSRFYGLDIWGIKTISSGLFGIPMGFIAIFVVSRMTAPPSQELQDFVESVRIPRGAAKEHEEGMTSGH
ncbi:MAG: cation acetate symporter [Thermodesulfovibrio sp.]|nr:cation acetate symporter [Thermodesulfovibrio sp.]